MSPQPVASDAVMAAWEAALEGRINELDKLAGARRWAPALQVAEEIKEGLARAEAPLVARHADAIARFAAAWARAAWHQGRPGRRVDALEAVFLNALGHVPDLTLQQVLDVAPGKPPEFEEVLGGWVKALGDWSGRWKGRATARSRLQREALRLHLGVSGLERLAARSDEVDVWLAWMDALQHAGRLEEALRAATQGSKSLYWPRHRLQLRLRQGALASQLDRTAVARSAWREVWRHRLCTAGLCMVWEAAGVHAPAFFAEELELAYTGERNLAPDLQVRIELLLGDAEVPVARLQAAEHSGWWTNNEHPATQVLPLLLRLSTQQPVIDEALLTARIWRATDDDRRWRPRPPDAVPTGWSSLVDQVIGAHPTWLVDAAAWRVTAANVLIELAGAVLDARARDAYLKVSALLVSLVEAGHVAGDPAAEAPLQAIRRRFPRHKALLKEIDATRAFSPVLRRDPG